MSDKIEGNGKCLCGAVQFTAKETSVHAGACHCDSCKTWGGGPLIAVSCGANVSFEGDDSISVYDSSPWAERAFCNKCGSHLFYRVKGNQEHIIPAGLFSNQEAFDFTHQIFIDKKAAYYDFANETSKMTEAEVFAKYGPSAD